MRVDRSGESVTKLHQQELRAVGHQEQAPNRANDTRHADQVTLSSRAQEISQFMQVVSVVPSERVERVAALRRAIEEGRYTIPEDALVERLLGVVHT